VKNRRKFDMRTSRRKNETEVLALLRRRPISNLYELETPAHVNAFQRLCKKGMIVVLGRTYMAAPHAAPVTQR
jgi:hypothetical protein